MNCKYCKKELIGVHPNTKYCNIECNQNYLIYKHNQKFENKECCVCSICGWNAESLLLHINKVHKISQNEYIERYNKTLDDITLKSCRKKWGDKLKGKNNPAFGHNGKYSPYSRNFIGYKNLSDKQIDNKIKKIQKKMSVSLKENQNMPSQIGYWIKRGHTEQEAKELISKRQSTFTLEKCIQKYGEKNGRNRWKERQEKWLSNYKKQNYSKVSQKLFWEIYELIKSDYREIYFAQLDENKKLDNSGKNYEYKFDYGTSFCKFDFYIKDINKVIEFDGDYWHGEKRGNQKRDKIREEKIINKGIQIYHVLERDYKNNPNNVIGECLYWLNL